MTKFGNFTQPDVLVGNVFNLFFKRTIDNPQFWFFFFFEPESIKAQTHFLWGTWVPS